MTTQKTGTLVAYRNYIQEFPNSPNTKMANDSLQHLTAKLNSLLNDADIFIDTEEYELAEEYLKKAALISPNDESVNKRLANIKNKQ